MRTRLLTALAATALIGAGTAAAVPASARTVISVGFGTRAYPGYYPAYYGYGRPYYYGSRYYGPSYYGSRYYGGSYRYAPRYYSRSRGGWSHGYSHRYGWHR